MGIFDKIASGLDSTFGFITDLDKSIKKDVFGGFDPRNFAAPEHLIGRAFLGSSGLKVPPQPGQGAPISFTDPTEQSLYNMSLALGVPQFMVQFKEKLSSNTITNEDITSMQTLSIQLSQIYNGTADPAQLASLQALDFLTNIDSEADFGSMDFLKTLSEFGTRMTGADIEFQDSSTSLQENLLRQQELSLQQQEFDLRQSRMGFERDGVTTFMSFLPSDARMSFLSKLIQTPKYAQLFFGGGGGPADGPYVGGLVEASKPQPQRPLGDFFGR